MEGKLWANGQGTAQSLGSGGRLRAAAIEKLPKERWIYVC